MCFLKDETYFLEDYYLIIRLLCLMVCIKHNRFVLFPKKQLLSVMLNKACRKMRWK